MVVVWAGVSPRCRVLWPARTSGKHRQGVTWVLGKVARGDRACYVCSVIIAVDEAEAVRFVHYALMKSSYGAC